jgi:hypothetical protein
MAQQVVLGHEWTDAVSREHSFSLLHTECLKTTNVCCAASCFYVPNSYSFFTLITLAYNEMSLAISKKMLINYLKMTFF